MRKFTGLLTLVVGIGLSGLALADTAKTTKDTAARSGQQQKHIGFVDLYLTTAVNDAKVLAQLDTASDKALIGEAEKDLGTAIDRSLSHVQKLRGAGAATDQSAKIEEIERQLKDAKAAAGKLAGTKSADLASAVDGVSTHLMGADSSFHDFIKGSGYTRLSETSLGTIPVRGNDSGATGGKSGEDQKPAVPKDMPKNEPVQPAPGNPPH